MISYFIIKKEPIELNVEIEVDINRTSKIFIEPMSKEFVLIDLCFLGSIFEDKPIIKSIKNFFRSFLDELFKRLDAVCATINYESDCRFLFLIDAFIPDDRYNKSNLEYDIIINQLYKNKFEYAILGKEVTQKEIEWLFISDDDIEW
jgi:hypothetical protein